MDNLKPDKPPAKRSRFYQALNHQRMIEDAIRLCYHAEQIAAAYAARRWGQEVGRE